MKYLLVIGTALLLCTGSAGAAALLQPGQTRIVGNENLGNKCLDVPNGDYRAGVRVIMFRCQDNSPNQVFNVIPPMPQPNGALPVMVWGPIRIAGLCLDAYRPGGGQSQNGDAVGLWTCHGGANQQWKFVLQRYGAPHYVLQNNGREPTPICLEIAGGSNQDGAQLIIATCNSIPSQLFQDD